MKPVFKLVLFLVLSLSLLPAHAFALDAPEDVVLNVLNGGIEIIQTPELQGNENLEKRRQALWVHFKPHFNLEEMAKRALGAQWKEITPEQRKEFSEVFKDILRNFYLGKIDSYRGEKVHYIRKLVQGNRCKVQTHVINATGDQFVVDFSLINDGQSWKGYDLSVEGVSVISNYRSQFKSILSKKSFEELMEQLRAKRDETRIEGIE